METPSESEKKDRRNRGEFWVAALLIACVVLVAFWEIMSNRSRRPFEPFALKAADFETFAPESDRWHIRAMPVSPDPIEPNILVYLLTPREERAGGPVLVRLVHGYNMVDCMRIKGDEVELLADTRRALDGSSEAAPRDDGRQLQIWRLTASTGREAIWITSMLRVGDFGETGVDTRSMPFPRIGIPDNPGWWPQGLSWKSLRNPVRNLRLFLRAKWNASRADLLTFLALRQPAWASDELLTLVAASTDEVIGGEDEAAARRQVEEAHAFMYRELRAWRERRLGEGGE